MLTNCLSLSLVFLFVRMTFILAFSCYLVCSLRFALKFIKGGGGGTYHVIVFKVALDLILSTAFFSVLISNKTGCGGCLFYDNGLNRTTIQ